MRFIAQKGRALLVMMTAAVLAVIGLAGCGGGDNNSGGGNPNGTDPGGGGRDSRLAGDWIIDNEREETYVEVLSLKPSGDIMYSYFFGFEGFWVEHTSYSNNNS